MSGFISIVVAGLIFSVELGLIVLSFSLTYRAIGFVNFAHVQFATLGATITVGFAAALSVWVSLPVAVVVTGLIAVLADFLIFRRIQEASVETKMIVSAGLSLLMMAGIQYYWGVNSRIFPHGIDGITIAGARIGYDKLLVLLIGLAVFVAFYVIMRATGFGRAIRATADDPDLVEIRGVSRRRVVTSVWFLAGGLAALGGGLLGVQTYAAPSVGFSILIPMFAAAVLGGLGSVTGALVGAVVLSFAQAALLGIDWGHLVGTSWYVPSAYQSVLQFVILISVLIFRPRGLFGNLGQRA